MHWVHSATTGGHKLVQGINSYRVKHGKKFYRLTNALKGLWGNCTIPDNKHVLDLFA